MTKRGGDEWKTVYGGVPLRCDGKHRAVHHFEIKSLKMDLTSLIIGIDHGRTHINTGYHKTGTYHYAVDYIGYFWEKGSI